MSRLPEVHLAPSHAAIRRRLLEAAHRRFLGPVGQGGWDPDPSGARREGDLGAGLLDVYALALHVLWTYQEAWAEEGFLPTARIDASVDRLLEHVAYAPSPGAAAIGLQHFECASPGWLSAGFAVQSSAKGEERAARYEVLQGLRVDPALNGVRAYLPPGTPTKKPSGMKPGPETLVRTPASKALSDRLQADRGGPEAARRAAKARIEARQLLALARQLKEVQEDTCCDDTFKKLCKRLCELQETTAADPGSPTPGKLTASQSIAARQLETLAKLNPDLAALLDEALHPCECESDEEHEKRLQAMAKFLDAFVAQMIREARDRLILLRGPNAVRRIERRAKDGRAPSRLGLALPGTDTLYLVMTRPDGSVRTGTFDGVRPGDWFVIGDDVDDTDALGRPIRARKWRQALRIVDVGVEKPAGVNGALTRITFEPRLQRRYRLDDTVLAGNNALVSEGTTVVEPATRGADGTIPIAQGPLTWLVDPQAPGGHRPEVALQVAERTWRRVDDLRGAGSTDAVFAVELTPGGGARVRVGDGQCGARPPDGAPLVVRYRTGTGAGGNRAALRVDGLASAHPSVRSTFNPLPFTGGADPEDRTLARIMAPRALRAMDRAVSVADVEALALQFDGVSRARVVRDPVRRRNHLTVVTCGPGGAALGPNDRESLRTFLATRVPPGVTLAVKDRVVVRAHLGALLRIAPGADAVAVLAEARVRLGVDDPPSSTEGVEQGLLHPDRAQLGRDVRLSDVYGALAGITGLRACVVRFLRRDGGQAVVSDRIAAGPLELLLWGPAENDRSGVHLDYEEVQDL